MQRVFGPAENAACLALAERKSVTCSPLDSISPKLLPLQTLQDLEPAGSNVTLKNSNFVTSSFWLPV